MSAVTYWRLPEEEADLLAYLQQDEALMAVPNELVDSPNQIVWKPLAEGLADRLDSFLIALPKFMRDIKIHRVDSEGVCIDVTSAPALLYERGRLVESNRLMPTTFTISTSYIADDERTTVDLPAEYVRWGKRILQWARRAAPDTYRFKSFRITPKAEAARKAGVEMIW